MTSEDFTPPGDDYDAESDFGDRRARLVANSIRQWTSELIDLGGRNNLLRYRELKVGTLELTDAEPTAISSFLQGRTIRISSLFSEPEQRERALRRIRAIHDKAKENLEERGIDTLYLACGLATWENKRTEWLPCAPVLLRQGTIRPLGAARDEFELSLIGEMEVNPTLRHLLHVDFDCQFDDGELLDQVDGVIDEPWELDVAYRWLIKQAARVPSFGIAPRLVLANFSYAKLPMVRDLENAPDELTQHDIIAAIAGVAEAREAIKAAEPRPDQILSPDMTPLADEFLILDADATQNYAINATIAGANLIVKGPPGTGKSQSIANMIAALVARGKRVLFVAEKRAAVDAVLKRLHQRKLDDIVLNVHGGVSSRRAFAETIRKSLAAIRTTASFDAAVAQRRVEGRRTELNEYARALHEVRQPWGLSIYEVFARLSGWQEASRTDFRFSLDQIRQLAGSVQQEATETLTSFVELGGLDLDPEDTLWDVATITTTAHVESGYAGAQALARATLAAFARAAQSAAEETGFAPPETVAGWQSYLDLWFETSVSLSFFHPDVFGADLPALVEHLSRGSKLSRFVAVIVSKDYRRYRGAARALLNVPNSKAEEILQHLKDGLGQFERWRALNNTNSPSVPSNRTVLTELYGQLLEQLRELTPYVRAKQMSGMPLLELRSAIATLLADRATLVKLQGFTI